MADDPLAEAGLEVVRWYERADTVALVSYMTEAGTWRFMGSNIGGPTLAKVLRYLAEEVERQCAPEVTN